MHSEQLKNWNAMRDALRSAEYDKILQCRRHISEVADLSKWPMLCDDIRGDVFPDFFVFLSDEAIHWLIKCKAIGIDNNQAVPWFVPTGRGIHIIGYHLLLSPIPPV